MYLEHWGLNIFPFENVSDERFFFESDTHRVLREDLQDAIARRKGAISLTGGIGCGKSTLIQRTLLSLPEDHFDVVLINYSHLTSIEMLFEICQQLDLNPEQNNRSSILHILQKHLVKNSEIGRTTLICIDEAQSIPSLETFEELRLLLNFQLGGHFLMSLLFVGQPELQQIIEKIPPLQQRIALHLSLQKMQPQDTARYILHRLRTAGCTQAILTRQAVEIIYRHTTGVPRRINHLMDRCLLVGMREKAPLLNRKLVETTIQRYPC